MNCKCLANDFVSTVFATFHTIDFKHKPTLEVTMLLLSLTAQRVRSVHPEMARLTLEGDITRAVQMGRVGVERNAVPGSARAASLIGQLLGRCLLVAGYEEDADELFRGLTRHYQDLSRAHVRWLGGLDQGCLMLHMNRPGRAAEALCAVADDPLADPELRIEAMALAAVALHRAGECRSGWQSLEAARRLAQAQADGMSCRLVDGIGLELAALQRARSAESIEDHALYSVYHEGAAELAPAAELQQQLVCAAGFFELEAPLVAQRLQYLSQLVSAERSTAAATGHVLDALAWARTHRFGGIEPALRVEATLMLITNGALNAAADVIAPLASDDKQIKRSRHAVDLHYCLSRLSQSQGRVADALRWYRSHSQEAVLALRQQATRRVTDSYMGAAAPTQAGNAASDDTARARLPLRYRRAYQYIIENLQDEGLSVQAVATQLGVTERALQMAFRTHLGMTPAELIRTRRAEGVRSELCAHAGDQKLDELAQRWGLRNRATLSSIYRNRFAETPAQTLKGGVALAA
jgi:AraC-like DNA-binding protein